MTNYEIREHLKLQKHNTEITREDFERLFKKTSEKIVFTFGGWDGKSYNGESRRASVYHTTIKGYENVKIVKVGKALHIIDEDYQMLEIATNEMHPTADWLVDVARA